MLRFFLVFFSFFLLSCAKEVSLKDSQNQSAIYLPSSSKYKNHYMTCNLLKDKTFRGVLYNSPRDNCLLLDIDKGPDRLFEDSSFSMQIYPFKVTQSELEYGQAIEIYTLDRSNNQTLAVSYVLDTHTVNIELQKEGSLFFQEHRFEICEIDDQWDGLQLVIYERRNSFRKEDPVPIRVSKVLKPPFLIHPEYFRDTEGVDLAAYHPFSDSISAVHIEPEDYYDRAEELCQFE